MTKLFATTLALFTLGATGCGGGTTANPDATPSVDAVPPANAENVQCPATVDLEVVTAGDSYNPVQATVAPGNIVRFTMIDLHSVKSNSNPVMFEVGFGQTGCVKFNKVGTYPYYCGSHGFQGSVIVQ